MNFAIVLGPLWTDVREDAAGGAAAISALKPPEDTKDHDDDKNCPNPKNKCKDCGGKNQMCTSGTDSGCQSYRFNCLSKVLISLLHRRL